MVYGSYGGVIVADRSERGVSVICSLIVSRLLETDDCSRLLSLCSTMIVEGLDKLGRSFEEGCVDNSIWICLLEKKSTGRMRGSRNDAGRKGDEEKLITVKEKLDSLV